MKSEWKEYKIADKVRKNATIDRTLKETSIKDMFNMLIRYI
jgi:hypothetical protein